MTYENVTSMNRFSAGLCQPRGSGSGMVDDNVRGADGAALRGDSAGIVVGLISCARSARCAGCASNPSACKIGISWIRCASSAANCARARIGTGLSVKCESADFANMVTDRLSGSAGASPWDDETMVIWGVLFELMLRSGGVQSCLWVPLACVFARQCSLLFNTRTRRHWRHKAAASGTQLCVLRIR